LIEDRVSGLLCPPDAEALAAAVLELADAPLLRERLVHGALAAVEGRTWRRALERLAEGYRRALGAAACEGATRAA